MFCLVINIGSGIASSSSSGFLGLNSARSGTAITDRSSAANNQGHEPLPSGEEDDLLKTPKVDRSMKKAPAQAKKAAAKKAVKK